MQNLQPGNVAHDAGFWFNVAIGCISSIAAILSAFAGYVIKTLKQSDSQQWAKIDKLYDDHGKLAEKVEGLLGEHRAQICKSTRRK